MNDDSNKRNNFPASLDSGVPDNRCRKALFVFSILPELTRMRMMPAWEENGYKSVSAKSVSWVRRMRDSAFACDKTSRL